MSGDFPSTLFFQSTSLLLMLLALTVKAWCSTGATVTPRTGRSSCKQAMEMMCPVCVCLWTAHKQWSGACVSKPMCVFDQEFWPWVELGGQLLCNTCSSRVQKRDKLQSKAFTVFQTQNTALARYTNVIMCTIQLVQLVQLVQNSKKSKGLQRHLLSVRIT